MMKELKKNFVIDLLPIVLMALLSLSGLIFIAQDGPSIAGLSTILGAILFFAYKARNKATFAEAGLAIKNIGKDIKAYWLIILVPSVLNVVSVALSKLIVPDFVDHVLGRADEVLSFDKVLLMILEFAVFAFLEELSWRGCMQKQINGYLNPVLSIIITSLIFAVGHASKGDTAVVIYDVFFVFCNSIFYGLAYQKTKNVYISTISHFLANATGALIVLNLFA
jgi:membrane protease YdiL (CAAX protease family)